MFPGVLFSGHFSASQSPRKVFNRKMAGRCSDKRITGFCFGYDGDCVDLKSSPPRLLVFIRLFIVTIHHCSKKTPYFPGNFYSSLFKVLDFPMISLRNL